MAQAAEQLIPGGLAPPPEIPPDIFAAATRTYVECRRVDMGRLAAELGISRATLFRRAGRRDALLGQVLWYLTRQTLAEALEAAGERAGLERVLFTVEYVMRKVSGEVFLRAFLEREPEIALRILTSKHGPIQQGIAETLERVLEEEQQRGMVLGIDRQALAYAIVRLGEGFLYADVIADQEPDVEGALQLMSSLLVAEAVDAPRSTATHPKTAR
jgi:AcrR family transcriptional regulator